MGKRLPNGGKEATQGGQGTQRLGMRNLDRLVEQVTEHILADRSQGHSPKESCLDKAVEMIYIVM
jgi:hypothetical protein